MYIYIHIYIYIYIFIYIYVYVYGQYGHMYGPSLSKFLNSVS